MREYKLRAYTYRMSQKFPQHTSPVDHFKKVCRLWKFSLRTQCKLDFSCFAETFETPCTIPIIDIIRFIFKINGLIYSSYQNHWYRNHCRSKRISDIQNRKTSQVSKRRGLDSSRHSIGIIRPSDQIVPWSICKRIRMLEAWTAKWRIL